MIYADNAATTKLDISVFEAMKPFFLDDYSNPSQPYSFSRASKKAIKEARSIIAKCINAKPEEIFFTSGGTESDNWAIKGVAFADAQKRATITTAIEHHAVLRSCASIERLGYPVAYLMPTVDGVVTPDALDGLITSSTNLVSVMYANNELGTIQPIKKLREIAHNHGALFHTDAVQAVGHVKIDVQELGVDMLSASAHKFNGPKGIGFLYIRKGTNLISYADGGSQELSHRAGTENVASIVGMATALKANCDKISTHTEHIMKLEKIILDTLNESHIDYLRNGCGERIPGNLSLSFKNADGEALLHRLDLIGIYVSTGSACDSVNSQVSHVLQSIGLPLDYAHGTIRISLGKNNTVNEAKSIANALLNILK